MKEKLMLGFAGEMGSGKGTATEIVRSAYPGTPSFRFSDTLRDLSSWMNMYMMRHGVTSSFDPQTKDLQDLSTELRLLFGQDILERGIIERVRTADIQSPIIMIDGIRRLSDIATLRRNTNFHLIYIHLNERVRWERHRARNEKPGDAELSFEDFRALGRVEAEREIRLLEPVASMVLTNDGGVLNFSRTLLPKIAEWL